ncbi:hypothetical protein L557_2858 [Bordetella pertussis STO1-CNMC-0004]|nr:hypothetical protein L557_2858 [Bordetella pertussis STO1-CNMC-0004]
MHGSSEPDLRNWKSHRARCTHLQTQPGRIQPIDSSHLAHCPARPPGGGLIFSGNQTWQPNPPAASGSSS